MAPAQIDTSATGCPEEGGLAGPVHKKTDVIFTRDVKIRMRDSRPPTIEGSSLMAKASGVSEDPCRSCRPPFAGTSEAPTEAREQSMASASRRRFRSSCCSRRHTPAWCQSRSRRQHVIPEPQPNSCGNICHGMPLRRTKRIPLRHARSGTRGVPRFARCTGIGRNGSTRSHNASGSSDGHNSSHYLTASG